MESKQGQASTEPDKEVCFLCGEGLETAPSGASSILCPHCEETSELPVAHHYLNHYYYRYAD
ncbi:hypothetical protein [Paenibacillus spongiae]|uniref:Uncharacterized protein n=1 Tax=Paenibacillus spongiae TaxID=2909671 RepID=A0ABY5SFM4_9BACL|nr:hypothetical protein [Paenibacillus spongiae]UVI31542.1 hypothetical protein L1F29_06900 [Paenibacillus spongiae]